MKGLILTFLLVFGFVGTSISQLPTWVDDIAPMMHDHCARCHHEGGAGCMTVVRDSGGKFVWSGTLDSEVSKVSVEGWASGMYSVEVLEVDGARFRSSLIVE